jgi:cell volume regulation protein A
MTGDAELILVAGALLAAGVVASIVADRLRLPALVLFLGVGMAIGTDGLGWIDFEDYERARLIGSAALLLILFEGGFGAGWSRIRPVLRPAISLAVIATIGTAAVAGVAAAALFDLSGREGLLVGAIVSGTDGAAVFALLRGTALPARLARTLEGEAGFNDPVAVLLVLVIIELITKGSYGATDVAIFVGRELLVGVAVGLGVGWAAARGLRSIRATPTGIVLVASLASAALAFGLAGVAHGSGFLAVYLVGLQLADAELPERAALRAFHEVLPLLPRSSCSSHWASSSSRASSTTSPSRPRCSGSSLRSSPARCQRPQRPPSSPSSTGATGCCWAGRACAAQCRWCSRRFPSSRTSTAVWSSSTSCSSPSWSRP